MAKPQQTDALDLLLQQHNEARGLMAEIDEATSPGARRGPFERLVRLLAVHETAEEEVVYPVLQTDGAGGEEVARARRAEEDQAKGDLSNLEKMGVEDPGFAAGFSAFRTSVLRHAANEEREVFPRLRASEDPDDLLRLGRALEVAEKAAPTHPHPHGPESAVGNVVVGPFVALVDRVRDAIRRKSA